MMIDGRLELDDLDDMLKRRGIETGGSVQRFIDNEVIKQCAPYAPFRTGYLSKTAPVVGTVIGSGTVKYAAPYARRQYYGNKGDGKRGKMWFERMKADHKREILEGAAKLAGGSAK